MQQDLWLSLVFPTVLFIIGSWVSIFSSEIKAFWYRLRRAGSEKQLSFKAQRLLRRCETMAAYMEMPSRGVAHLILMVVHLLILSVGQLMLLIALATSSWLSVEAEGMQQLREVLIALLVVSVTAMLVQLVHIQRTARWLINPHPEATKLRTEVDKLLLHWESIRVKEVLAGTEKAKDAMREDESINNSSRNTSRDSTLIR